LASLQGILKSKVVDTDGTGPGKFAISGLDGKQDSWIAGAEFGLKCLLKILCCSALY
jgi:hypothetical protein